MVALYITFLNEDIRPGYKIKIHSQCKAFYELGYDSYLFIVKDWGMALYSIADEEKLIQKYYNNKTRRKQERNLVDEFILLHLFVENLIKVIKNLCPDIVYIRRLVPANPWFNKVLKIIKGEGIKIVYEYPTYPWKKEMLKNKQYLLLLIEQFFYRKTEKLADVIAYMGNYHGNNKKFLKIYNCVEVDRFKEHKKTEGNDINLIGVAHVAYYHGYDRIIRGLADYYKNSPTKNVYFHIVGPVDERLKLKELSIQLKVENYIFFHGFKTGFELDALFDCADIGVESLALFRIGKEFITTSSLKSREYLARGIPYIRSAENVFDDSKLDFIFSVENTDTPVDIDIILKQYNAMKSDSKDIRKYARENLAWSQQMKKIIEKIRNEGKNERDNIM